MAVATQKPSWAKRLQLVVGALVLMMGAAQTALMVTRGNSGGGAGGRAWFGALAVFGGGLGFIHRSPAGPLTKWGVTVLAVALPWLFVVAMNS
ncbi:MAG: hypothetical protein HYV07_07445 [Deltaproteobacteria bacterium]|nr:hypothetical protein [Deltaproteobacteria bacterium]